MWLYAINIDNDGDGKADISYVFEFQSETTNLDTFLYNTGPISSLTDPNWNRRQTYTVTRMLANGKMTVLGGRSPLPTVQHRASLHAELRVQSGQRRHQAGGQRDQRLCRAEGRGLLRGPRFHLRPGCPATFRRRPHPEQPHPHHGRDQRHQGPERPLHRPADPHRPAHPPSRHAEQPGGSKDSVIGVWTTALRQAATVLASKPTPTSSTTYAGPWVQVSRLGNPLINEVIIPMSQKDYWNHEQPAADVQFAQYVSNPELARLLPILYPGPAGGPAPFANLAAYNASGTPNRADLTAILMTGIPSGIIPGFQNFTGTVQADMLRLNLAIPPAVSSSTLPSNKGLLGGDLAGFPNGRRVFDDVVTIEIEAVAGATLGLVDPSFTPDPAASGVNQGLTSSPTDLTATGTENYLPPSPTWVSPTAVTTPRRASRCPPSHQHRAPPPSVERHRPFPDLGPDHSQGSGPGRVRERA